MVKFTFSGFGDGTSVAVSVSQSGASASGAVPAWGQNVAGVAINAIMSGAAVAPAGVILEATGHTGFDRNGPVSGEVYDPTHDGIFYVWTVDGQPLSPFTNAALNIPSEWRNRNVMYGPKVAFVFDDTRSYTVDLWCVELSSGKTATATWSISVADGAELYSGAATAVYDPSGSFVTGRPSGATVLSSEAALISFLSSGTGGVRVLFPKGSDFTFDQRIAVSAGFARMHFGAYGTGADPILRIAHNDGQMFRFTSASFQSATFSGLRMLGGWDAAKEAGRPMVVFGWLSSATNPFCVIDKCEISGEVGYYTLNNTGRILVHDTYVHDWGGHAENVSGYGFYVGGGAYAAVVGCALHQNPNGCLGATGTAPFLNYGAALRDASEGKTVLACSSFFNAGGWSGGGVNYNAAQSPLRLNTSGRDSWKGNIDRVYAEGGFWVIGSTEDSGTSGPTEFPCNFVADKLIIVPNAASTRGIGWSYNGTFRNVIGILPNISRFTQDPSDIPMFVHYLPQTIDARLAGSPLRHYNCTVLNQHASKTIGGPQTQGAWTNVTIENNVEYDAVGGQISDGPMDLTETMSGVAPISQAGQRFSVTKASVTLGADVPNGGTVQVTYPARRWRDPISNSEQSTQLANTDMDDASTLHAVWWDAGYHVFYRLEDGQISVDFSNSAYALVTNFTGATWPSGRVMKFNLVPKDTANPTESAYGIPASTLPWPKLASGGGGENAGDFGDRAYDDAVGTVRPALGNDRGALVRP